MADFSERIEALSPEKQAILILRLRREGAAYNSFPLSLAQEHLWLFDLFVPGSIFFNVPSAMRLSGPFDAATLERSLNEVVRRHATLRTMFGRVGQEPVQIVAPHLQFELPVIDLQSLGHAEREAETMRLAGEEAARPFDLARGPLFRATLLKLGEQEHVLLLTLHHIISDGWSMGILMREISTLYAAFAQGHPSPLPELPIQYTDFARWQRQALKSPALGAQLSYWKRKLEGDLQPLQFHTSRPRSEEQSFQTASQSLALPLHLSEAIKDLSRRSGVTVFMMLLAAFKALLHRYTGQDDIRLGTLIANRNRSETEGLIGFFINTLVLRTSLSGNPTFLELLERVRHTALTAYAHQDLPFEELAQVLTRERDLRRTSLFQVMFLFQNASPESPQTMPPGLVLGPLGTGKGEAETELTATTMDLVLEMRESDTGIVGSLLYKTELFDAAAITRMLNYFEMLLEHIVTRPEQPLSALPDPASVVLAT